MKKTLILMLTLLVMSVYAFSEVKIGIINAQEVFQKTKRGSQIQKELEALNNKKAAELKALQEEIKKLEKDLLSPALNASTRDAKSVDLQSKRTTFKRKYEDAQSDLQRESQKKLLELEKELMPLITNLGKSKGFTIIFDRARSGVIYFDSGVDVTKEVIAAIDAKLK
ncbi:MAG: OmpH family outer membrane protein [bacterium]|nr:OmpH family outer membrane protein [bacterium]